VVSNPVGGFIGRLFLWKAFLRWNLKFILRAFISFERSKEEEMTKMR
jgi:hypothetical protein